MPSFHPGHTIRSQSLDDIFVPPLDPSNTPVQNSMLDVGNIKIVFGHLLHSMHGHVVLPKSNLFPDPFNW